MTRQLIYTPTKGISANAAGFMSGSGTNLVEILKMEKMLLLVLGYDRWQQIRTINPLLAGARKFYIDHLLKSIQTQRCNVPVKFR